jgi:hypothetical protein
MSAIASSTMPRRLPPGCIEDRDRHGNIRIYFRARGRPKVRLRGTPWTPEFMAEYDTAKGQTAPMRGKGITPGTWRWLCVRYFGECADYLRLDGRTKRVRRGILEATFDEPIAPGSSKFFRDFPLSKMTTDAIEVLRDRKLAFPEGANNRVHRARPAQSGRDNCGQQRSDGASAHGDLRLGQAQNGGSLHTRRRSTTLGGIRNAHVGNARTKRHRIVSHRGA